MKASELRIGNYLQGSSGAVRVTKIFDEDNIGIGGGDPYNVSSETPCLFPVPLTEEWLLKFGFIFSESFRDYFYKIIGEGNILFRVRHLHGTARIDGSYLDSPCKYVHQLQNLFFALTGNELTVSETVNLN